MSIDWEPYIQAQDWQQVEQAARQMEERAWQEQEQEERINCLLASRLYLIRGEYDYGTKDQAYQMAWDLIKEQELLSQASPAWRSRVYQWYAHTLEGLGDCPGAAAMFEAAAQIREDGYQGSQMVPDLLNQASRVALSFGAAEWAYELARRSLDHLDQYPVLLDDPKGVQNRRAASLCLYQALHYVEPVMQNSRRRKRKNILGRRRRTQKPDSSWSI